jgi:hypothetical protein
MFTLIQTGRGWYDGNRIMRLRARQRNTLLSVEGDLFFSATGIGFFGAHELIS